MDASNAKDVNDFQQQIQETSDSFTWDNNNLMLGEDMNETAYFNVAGDGWLAKPANINASSSELGQWMAIYGRGNNCKDVTAAFKKAWAISHSDGTTTIKYLCSYIDKETLPSSDADPDNCLMNLLSVGLWYKTKSGYESSTDFARVGSSQPESSTGKDNLEFELKDNPDTEKDALESEAMVANHPALAVGLQLKTATVRVDYLILCYFV